MSWREANDVIWQPAVPHVLSGILFHMLQCGSIRADDPAETLEVKHMRSNG